MQVGDLVKSNYPDMEGAIGIIVEVKTVTYWMNGTVEQYRIDWVNKDHKSIGVMWMTVDTLEKI